MLRHTTETAIVKAKKKHGNRYGYELFEYNGDKQKSIVVCRIHGKFSQRAGNHLQGQGCSDCRVTSIRASQSKGLNNFIRDANQKHGNRYDYSKFIYVNGKTGGIVICPSHGEFIKTPVSHVIKGRGCPKCTEGFYERKTTDDFVNQAQDIHTKYDYSKVCYNGAFDKVTIICPIHGDFLQAPKEHLRGQGCPQCQSTTSKAHIDLNDSLMELGIHTILNDRTIIAPSEIDIFIPDAKIGIEYCGLYWHSDSRLGKNYHSDKYHRCADLGIRLITIFEDEWINRRDIVLSTLAYALQISSTSIGARKLTIIEISSQQSQKFLEKYHIAGKSRGKIHIGAMLNSQLVGVMVFGSPTRQSKYDWELLRFASSGSFPGMASRLFKWFVRQYNPVSIVTFSDLRWFSGKVYEFMGFKFDGVIPPTYSYFKSKKRFHKSYFRKDRIHRREGIDISGKTERKLTAELGYERIWDCGKNRYVWFNP